MPASPHFWERTVLGWHLYFAVMLVVAGVAAAGSADWSVSGRTAAVALLAVWAVWYAVLGRRLWAEPNPRRTGAYVVGMVLLSLGAAILVPASTVSFFIAIPHIYAMVNRLLLAAGLVFVLFGGFAIALIVTDVGDGFSAAGPLAVSAAFSVVIGSWIGGIIRQSTERATLIEELQETRAELGTVAAERGALAERERLSRDIHDTVAQGFTSIVMLLEATEPMLGRDDAAARRHLELASRTAREGLAETRSLVAALTPTALAGGTLADAVRRLAARAEEELGVPVTATVTGAPRRLAAAVEVVLLRAAQESLANVRRHAAANRVELGLDYRDDRTLLTVRDDGRGFDPQVAGGGYGLPGMRARVEEAGGELRVTSAPGAGTTVEVRL